MTAPGDRAQTWIDEDVERLTTDVLDLLGSELAWWRAETARRVGLDAVSLVCIELARRRGRVSAAAIVERTGLTRSAVSKLLRRLRDEGHLDLHGGGQRGLALEATLRAHPERDAELERLHARVRERLLWSVGRAYDGDERAVVLRALRDVAGTVHRAAAECADDAAEARRIARRGQVAGRGPAAVTWTTGPPSSSEASRSTSAVMPQSWSPSGSSNT